MDKYVAMRGRDGGIKVRKTLYCEINVQKKRGNFILECAFVHIL